MKKRQNLVPESRYAIKCPYTMQAEYITVHNTANDASAWNETANVNRAENTQEVSFHWAVDDIEAVQLVHTNRNAWACGDGANGTGNRKSISVEICYSKSGGPKFDQAEKNAAKLIAELLKEHGFGIDRVKRHYDWSKKNCPERTMNLGWQRFLNMIQAELNPPIVTPTPGTGATMYRVVTGSFSSKANADKRVSDLKAKGFDSFIDVYTK